MPAIEISRSMLVNQGLSALASITVLAEPDGVPAVADPVASFKQLVADGALSVTDRDLVATITAFASPLELATYFINAKYAELGGAKGVLGATTSAVGVSGAGFVRTFQRGAIYFHPQVGAHEVHGPVRVKWQELGGERGFLGFPTSDVTPGADVRSEGVSAHFQGGSIYWAPLPVTPPVAATSVTGTLATATPRPAVTATAVAGAVKVDLAAVVAAPGIAIVKHPVETSAGAFEVHGAIREKYLALGAEASILGYPRTDETGTPDGIGRYNHFQGGSIYWTPATYAHEVHGLIRDRWASLGWERNPQLGYPISDELIPDPRIGHRRPEAQKKPIASVPSDVVKLPAEAALAGFPASVVNTPGIVTVRTAAMAVAPPATTAATTTTISGGALGRLSDAVVATPIMQLSPVITLDPAIISITPQAASTAAEARSVNRFGDFENGVLFWFRGATAATTLAPLAATSDGTSLSFSGADVANAAVAKIGRGTFESGNAHVTSVTFIGTTGYSFDGAQTHNRRHRLQLIVQGLENTPIGPFGGLMPTVVTAMIELQVEVWFDASQRRIALTPIDWSLTQASSGSYSATILAALRSKLDPLLWTSYALVTLPDTNAGAPIAVLSVKTLVNGAVAVFVEPRNNLVLGRMTEIANAVAPSVVLVP